MTIARLPSSSPLSTKPATQAALGKRTQFAHTQLATPESLSKPPPIAISASPTRSVPTAAGPQANKPNPAQLYETLSKAPKTVEAKSSSAPFTRSSSPEAYRLPEHDPEIYPYPGPTLELI